MARHVNEGGSIQDEIGECIFKMVREMGAMRHFVRSTKNRQFEDSETADMTHAAIQHYTQLKNTLRHLHSKKHYDAFANNYQADDYTEEDIDVDALRERFVKKVYDDRFTEALPVVYNAYKRQQESIDQLGEELSEWAEDVYEGTWAKPDNDDKIRALQELLKSPQKAGIDGVDGIARVEQIIGDDDLNDAIFHLAQGQGPDQDIRPLVKVWLQDNMPGLLDQLNVGEKNVDDNHTNHVPPVSPKQDPGKEYGEMPAHSNVDNMAFENTDPLDFIRSLAGISRK